MTLNEPGGVATSPVISILPTICMISAAIAFLLGGSDSVRAQESEAPAAEAYRDFSPDGAWCWFSDPRAVAWHGKFSRTYAGWVTSEGDVAVGAFDHDKKEMVRFTLHEKFERDDHASPGLLFREDGRLMVFYSKHSDSSMRLRVSRNPEDISSWEEERKLSLNPLPREKDPRAVLCYANPVRLSGEANRIDVFWRGSNWKPCVSSSLDGGATWERGRIAFSEPGSGAGVRPYLKAANDGDRRTHFAMTDGHPRNESTNSIYYCYSEGPDFFRADGTRIPTEGVVAQRDMDRVYYGGPGDGGPGDAGEGTGRSWIWDIALDQKGLPVLVYTRLPDESRHIYHYARFDGKKWIDTRITPGGSWFPRTPQGKKEPEPHYSGGVVLDQVDPSIVYLSRPVDGVFEIEEWKTLDAGKTFTRRAITSHSKYSNVRPVSVRSRVGSSGPRVLWMNIRGRYVHYTNYETSIKMNLLRK